MRIEEIDGVRTAVIEASHLGDNMMQLLRRGRAIAAANGRVRPNADDRAQAIREISEAHG